MSTSEIPFHYPCHAIVQYTNDNEYRACIRQVFQMNEKEKNTDDDMDAVSRDELDYDMDAFSKFIDNVFINTRENSDLFELYKNAAAVFFSLDEVIGLSVLFSFDYFHHFHKCLCMYFTNKELNVYCEGKWDMTKNSSFNYLKSIIITK